jgi:hypothetical protein
VITCPKCKSSNLVCEQPHWELDKSDDEKIIIMSYCIDCKTDFETIHKISKPIKYQNIVKSKGYSY